MRVEYEKQFIIYYDKNRSNILLFIPNEQLTKQYISKRGLKYMIKRPINFTEGQYKKLKEYKNKTGLGMGATVRLAITEYFERNNF